MKKLLLILLLSSLFSITANAIEKSIPAGTIIKTRIAETIDSRVRNNGYQFRVTLDSDITLDGKTVINSGSKAQGVITQLQKSAKGLAPPSIIITLTNINIANKMVIVDSFQVAGKGKSRERQKAGKRDDDQGFVVDQQGEKISVAITVKSKGYDLILTEGTIIYFTLKAAIVL